MAAHFSWFFVVGSGKGGPVSSPGLGLGPGHLPGLRVLIEQLLDKVDLHEAGEDDHGALDQRPSAHVAQVGGQQVHVPGLQTPGQLLELPHDLDALVHVAQGLREVLDGHVHVLELLGKLFPLVVAEGGQVEVHQLGAELGELIVQADGIVSAGGRVLLVLGAGLPGVGMHHLALGIAHREPDGSVTPCKNN